MDDFIELFEEMSLDEELELCRRWIGVVFQISLISKRTGNSIQIERGYL
jgi:hypothetical protein